MTDDEFKNNCRQMALALIGICEQKGIDQRDSAKIIGAACAEAIAYFIGHAFAAERLRDIADICEQEVLKAH